MPRFLTVDQVVEIHEIAIRRYGGAPGIRDGALLDSAVHMPQATFAGQFLHRDVMSMAAAYLLHLAANHPFVDGNKRTAWLCTRLFLRLNGYSLKVLRDVAVRLVLNVSEGSIREWRTIAEWIGGYVKLVE